MVGTCFIGGTNQGLYVETVTEALQCSKILFIVSELLLFNLFVLITSVQKKYHTQAN